MARVSIFRGIGTVTIATSTFIFDCPFIGRERAKIPKLTPFTKRAGELAPNLGRFADLLAKNSGCFSDFFTHLTDFTIPQTKIANLVTRKDSKLLGVTKLAVADRAYFAIIAEEAGGNLGDFRVLRVASSPAEIKDCPNSVLAEKICAIERGEISFGEEIRFRSKKHQKLSKDELACTIPLFRQIVIRVTSREDRKIEETTTTPTIKVRTKERAEIREDVCSSEIRTKNF